MSGEKAGIVEAIGQALESVGITEDMVTGCVFAALGTAMFLLWFFVIRHIKSEPGATLPLATTDELVASLTAGERKAARVQADEWLLKGEIPIPPERQPRRSGGGGRPLITPEAGFRRVFHNDCPGSKFSGITKRYPKTFGVLGDGSELWLWECLHCGLKFYAGVDKRYVVTVRNYDELEERRDP